MAVDYGFKVMKTGFGVSETDIRNILMSSKYSMLKYHSSSAVSVTFTPGDTDEYVEVEHNLGYVPAFIAYMEYEGKIYFVPSVPRASEPGTFIGYAWSDTNKIRVGAVCPNGWNTLSYPAYAPNDAWRDIDDTAGTIFIGNLSGSNPPSALRFSNILLANSAGIESAKIDMAVDSKGAGTGQVKFKTWGIDEDNTGEFSASPTGRTKTTAVTTNDTILPPTGETISATVTSQVQEITTRAGWASGNALGFIFNDDTSPENVYLIDWLGSGTDSTLTIVKSGNITLDYRVIIFKDKIA